MTIIAVTPSAHRAMAGLTLVPVIIFDRWTRRGVADSTVAANGVPFVVHPDAPYQNVNTKITSRIPVAKGADFTYKHCVAADQPLSRSPRRCRRSLGSRARRRSCC